MNKTLDNTIWTPDVSQHGGHMIMENVKKPSKIKYINVDSRFQEEYNSNKDASFMFQLPQKLTEVKSIAVRCAEIPMTFYYFSAKRGNTTFKITGNNGSSYVRSISDGNYTANSLQSQLNNIITNINPALTLNLTSNGFIIYNNGQEYDNIDYTFHWDVDIYGEFQKNNFKSSLGWCLGFRQQQYTIPSNAGSLITEGALDIYNTRYLFLVVDEFRQSNPNSFVSPLHSSLISKNILARITLNSKTYDYGSILPANIFNGLLLSDQRVYSGKTDIQKLHIQLVDEWSNIVDLNQIGFSFCLEIEHE